MGVLRKYTRIFICLTIGAIYVVSNAESRPPEATLTSSPSEKVTMNRSESVNSTTKFNLPIKMNATETIKPSACRPEPNPNNTQYIIGYGSLMQNESKVRTAPGTGDSIPVLVKGFRREWNSKGDSVGLSTTYLGVVNSISPNDVESSFNAIIFEVLPNVVKGGSKNSKDLLETLASYDEREAWYCRQKVPNQNVISLIKNRPEQSKAEASNNEDRADYWIYVNKPEFTAPPSPKYPIVQSYVDIFISGCLETENKFQLPNFTDFCISSTNSWSKEWINDRIYPRRPFIHQPKAKEIDEALARNIPKYFNQIVLE